MLLPTPLSLICALLLCLPLAIVFTITSTATTTTATDETPVTILVSTIKNTTAAAAATSSPPPTRSPPPLLYIDDDDDEFIFQLAARPSPPASGAKKLAFMFLTNTPLPLAPLWELYFNHSPTNLYNIYIHADPSFPYVPPFTGVFAHRVIPSKPTRRFTPSLVAAARRLLAHALLHDPSNSHFALLSPSCIPLHSFNFTYRTVVQSKKSFIEILKDEAGLYGRWAARGPQTMLPEVRLESFRIGSQFWILTRKHARFVVNDTRLWSKFKLPCVRWDTCFPEENYFSTLLSMLDPRGCVPATLTHVDWRGRFNGHPRMYRAPVVTTSLILSLRESKPRYGDYETNGSDSSVSRRNDPFLFARKFSPNSLQPLMSIANDIIFKD